jgi:hypothetical protein
VSARRSAPSIAAGTLGCLLVQTASTGSTSPEGDDAAHRVVRRDANGDAISWNHFDSEPAHPAAQLSEYFVAGVALDSIQAAAVDSDDSALHVDEVVLAQIVRNPFRGPKENIVAQI